MRHLVVALIIACTLSSIVVLADEQYTTKYDNIDVDSVINSDRLLNGYVGCLLDRTPCTPDAAERSISTTLLGEQAYRKQQSGLKPSFPPRRKDLNF